MKNTFLFLLVAFITQVLTAQADKRIVASWTAVENRNNDAIVFGTKGTAAAGNFPGLRAAPAYCTDSSGIFWLFGGYTNHSMNDLWSYEPATKQWTWHGGGTESNEWQPVLDGFYGEKGISDPDNLPPARAFANLWADHQGNIWLFGGMAGEGSGASSGTLNDLWKYNIVSGVWTWMNGSNVYENAGVFGEKGVAADGNMPSGRMASATWSDPVTKNLWVFGGRQRGSDYPSDLWRYDPETNRWTWMSGFDQTNRPGQYVDIRTESASAFPQFRVLPYTWTDPGGKFWMYGGNGERLNNDLWRYNPATNRWTWMNGSNTNDSLRIPRYGVRGEHAPGNYPGTRTGGITWLDPKGNVFIFGGSGLTQTVAGSGSFNEVWHFDIQNNEWAWVSGGKEADQGNKYSTIGASSPRNLPAGRSQFAGWTESIGRYWMFGGNRGDVWKLDISYDTISSGGLVAYYPFDVGALAKDKINALDYPAADGTPIGATAVSNATNVAGKAVAFNNAHGVSATQYITISDTAGKLALTDEFSIAFHVKPGDQGMTAGSPNTGTIFYNNNVQVVSRGRLAGSGLRNRIEARIGTDVISDTVDASRWTQVVVVRKRKTASDYTIQLYAEAVLLKEVTSRNTPLLFSPVFIGKGVAVSTGYVGELDELRFYDVALTSEKVREIFVGELPPGPFRLLSFTGSRELQYNELKWAATDEQQVLRYEIEKKVDEGAFVRIDTTIVPNNNGEYTYREMNHKRNCEIIYRLKIVFQADSSQYSDAVKIKCPGNVLLPGRPQGLSLPTIFPNPVLNYFEIRRFPQFNNVVIEVYNQNGVQVQKARRINNSRVFMGNLAPGPYFIHVISPDGSSEILKVLKK